MENLNAMQASGKGFNGWVTPWRDSRAQKTSLGNQRLELVSIGYYHPLMPLIPSMDRQLQLALHHAAVSKNFGDPSKAVKGIFPPETAFAENIIPELASDGLQWTLVDNIHFDRARPDYPWTKGSNLFPPNAADQRDTAGDVNWVALQNLWAPSQVSAPWGYQPHYVEYIDPQTGKASRIIAVPGARYEGNEDARGGYGAFLYEAVMSQYEKYNTDDAHPMLIVLHHDGDNYGGGTESYYHQNFQNFVAWVQSKSDRFEATTVQDYLDRFPPSSGDVIHVEPGSWSGADNGDPQFSKWNGKPGTDGYSPDRNSWAVVTAAANRVHTAQTIAPYKSLDAIVSGNGTNTENAWHYQLVSETSCYWYWDNTENGKWDSHPTRAANMAVDYADKVISTGQDTTPPTIFMPQREPYNPGGIEWGTTNEASDFDVYTYVYDVSGLNDVSLYYRVTPKGKVGAANQVYSGGTWTHLAMQKGSLPTSKTDPVPKYRADEYRVKVVGVSDALVDYYVTAIDGKGITEQSPIQHVYVGTTTSTQPVGSIGWSPTVPTQADSITVWAPKKGKLHWGINGWQLPANSLWPTSTAAFDTKSVETPMDGPDGQGKYTVLLKPFQGQAKVVDFVVHYDDNSWDNSGGGDYHITLSDSTEPSPEPSPEAGPPEDASSDSSLSTDSALAQDSQVIADSSTTADSSTALDSSTADSSTADSSTADSSTAADSGLGADSGASGADSGVAPDGSAGGDSGSTKADAATNEAAADDSANGCSCHQAATTRGQAHWAVVGVGLALAWLARRKK
jgi:hypothetical protein